MLSQEPLILNKVMLKEKKTVDTTFVKREEDNEPSGAELLKQWREQKKRIAFLEAEVNRLKGNE